LELRTLGKFLRLIGTPSVSKRRMEVWRSGGLGNSICHYLTNGVGG